MRPLERLEAVRARRPLITVIGDFLLDGWWSGRIERIAREAPAPVVDLADRRDAPGGAANTALNLAALGARVQAVGVIGADEAGRRLRSLLDAAGIDVSRLRAIAGGRTTTKVRVSVDDQLLVRLDETHGSVWPPSALAAFVEDAHATAEHSDAQLICDYGSSVLTDEVVDRLATGPRPPLRVVDAHEPQRWRDLRPDVVTPNAAEAERVLGASLGADEDRVDRAREASGPLLEGTGAEAVVVTLDRTGTVLLRADGEPHRTHAHPVPEKQATGAGDVFVSALTVARAAALPLGEAVELAQQAADVAVRKSGTCVCSLDELEAWLGRPADLAITAEELAVRLEAHRSAGDRIVFTNGCFDVLHRGHTSCLRQAKRLGDVLVVGVNSDASARRLKGPGRPVNGAKDRANVLAELSCVDYVTVFDEDTACELIRRFAPDVYAKGGDYTPEMLAEADEVRRIGGEVVMLDYVPDHSTSELIDRIRETPLGAEHRRTEARAR